MKKRHLNSNYLFIISVLFGHFDRLIKRTQAKWTTNRKCDSVKNTVCCFRFQFVFDDCPNRMSRPSIQHLDTHTHNHHLKPKPQLFHPKNVCHRFVRSIHRQSSTHRIQREFWQQHTHNKMVSVIKPSRKRNKQRRVAPTSNARKRKQQQNAKRKSENRTGKAKRK